MTLLVLKINNINLSAVNKTNMSLRNSFLAFDWLKLGKRPFNILNATQ